MPTIRLSSGFREDSAHTSAVPLLDATSPVNIFTNVDFPAPFGPRTAQMAPAET
jgi:hypothetical protein